jgi:hypothetical protein
MSGCVLMKVARFIAGDYTANSFYSDADYRHPFAVESKKYPKLVELVSPKKISPLTVDKRCKEA